MYTARSGEGEFPFLGEPGGGDRCGNKPGGARVQKTTTALAPMAHALSLKHGFGQGRPVSGSKLPITCALLPPSAPPRVAPQSVHGRGPSEHFGQSPLHLPPPIPLFGRTAHTTAAAPLLFFPALREHKEPYRGDQSLPSWPRGDGAHYSKAPAALDQGSGTWWSVWGAVEGPGSGNGGEGRVGREADTDRPHQAAAQETKARPDTDLDSSPTFRLHPLPWGEGGGGRACRAGHSRPCGTEAARRICSKGRSSNQILPPTTAGPLTTISSDLRHYAQRERALLKRRKEAAGGWRVLRGSGGGGGLTSFDWPPKTSAPFARKPGPPRHAPVGPPKRRTRPGTLHQPPSPPLPPIATS